MVGFNSTQRAHGDHVIHQPFSKLIDFYLSPSPVRRNRHANSMAKYRRNTPIPLIIKFLLFLPMRDLLGTSLLDPTSKQMPNGRVLSIYVHGTFSLSLFWLRPWLLFQPVEEEEEEEEDTNFGPLFHFGICICQLVCSSFILQKYFKNQIYITY
jgi:hypothetical protein